MLAAPFLGCAVLACCVAVFAGFVLGLCGIGHGGVWWHGGLGFGLLDGLGMAWVWFGFLDEPESLILAQSERWRHA